MLHSDHESLSHMRNVPCCCTYISSAPLSSSKNLVTAFIALHSYSLSPAIFPTVSENGRSGDGTPWCSDSDKASVLVVLVVRAFSQFQCERPVLKAEAIVVVFSAFRTSVAMTSLESDSLECHCQSNLKVLESRENRKSESGRTRSRSSRCGRTNLKLLDGRFERSTASAVPGSACSQICCMKDPSRL
jgi:hypothetical protein